MIPSKMESVAHPQANPLTLLKNKRALPRYSTQGVQRAFHFWHLASLDAPTVAVIWTITFARVAHVYLNAWVLALIACGTWTVYVGDRLLDARRAISSGALHNLRERHFFHWHHRRWLIPGACVAAAIAAILIVDLMPSSARPRDSVLAAAALLYFSGVHSAARLPRWIRKLTSKEFVVGLLFTAGCAAPTLARLPSLRWPFAICLAAFTALAWLNCSAIERWESSALPTNTCFRSSIVSVACFASAAVLSFTDIRVAGLICLAAISALLLVLLDRVRPGISRLTARAFADIALLTPMILLALTSQHR